MRNSIKKYFKHVFCIVLWNAYLFCLFFMGSFMPLKQIFSQNNMYTIKQEAYLDSILSESQKAVYSLYPLKGKEMIQEVKTYSKDHNLNKTYAKALIYESRYYTLIGDLKTAIDLLHQAEEILSKFNDKKTMGDCYKAMSITYSKLTDPRRDRNIELSIKAINAYQAVNFEQGIISARTNLCNEYIYADKLDSAAYQLNLLKQNLNNKPYFYFNLNKGMLLLKQKKYNDAQEEFQKCINLAEKIDSKITALTYSGKCYALTGQLETAVYQLNKAVLLAQEYKIPPDEIEALEEIISVYLSSGNYYQAFNYQVRLNKLKDSLENINERNVIAEIEAKLRINEKNRIIQQKDSDMQIQKEKNKIRILFLASIIFMLVILTFLLVSYNYKSKKTLEIITSQKKELEQKKETLEKLNIINQKIFSIISHDFFSPLITLYHLTELLQKDTLSTLSKEDIDFYADDIKNQITQSQQILNNLLLWAKTELNPLSSHTENCNLHKIFEEIIKEFSHSIAKKQLVVKNNIDPGFEIKYNPNIIKIVFRNLLSNAIKFSFQKGSIEAKNEHKTFVLKDNGTGIEQTSFPKLFTGTIPSKSGTNNENGFGLGLFIISEIITKFGGKIWAEHNTPSGLVFKIQFHHE